MRLYILFVTSIFHLLGSTIVSASGGGGYRSDTETQSGVDRLYEEGKSYYKARLGDGTRLEYCIKGDSGLAKLSRKSAKAFKGGSSAEFVSSLYSCADSNLKIADAVAANQVDAILYYLDKRFKLELKSNSDKEQ